MALFRNITCICNLISVTSCILEERYEHILKQYLEVIPTYRRLYNVTLEPN